MKTIVYIDGFNLYYRALKGTPYRWLNIKTLAESLLGPRHQIVGVKYYTARVSGRADPDAPRRQAIYLKALRTVPEVSIYFGSFLFKQNWRRLVDTSSRVPTWRPASAHVPQGLSRREPLTNPIPGEPAAVEIFDTEEKGSDVNLASHLIHDGWMKRYDAAAILTNDTDLVEPIRIVRHEVGNPVGLLCPTGSPARSLRQTASFIRNIRNKHLAQSQFPHTLAGGTIVKPAGW